MSCGMSALACFAEVTKASGVGEFLISVTGPVSEDVSQNFLLPKARHRDRTDSEMGS